MVLIKQKHPAKLRGATMPYQEITFLLSSGLYRRFRNFTESAQILCARGLYHRWRISLRPETDYIYIICLFLRFVKWLFETCFAVLIFGDEEALKICRLIDKRHKTYSCVSYLDCLFDIVHIGVLLSDFGYKNTAPKGAVKLLSLVVQSSCTRV